MGINICSEEKSTHKNNKNNKNSENTINIINTGKVMTVTFRADTEEYDKRITVYESITLREAIIQAYTEQINEKKLKIHKAI